MRRYLVLSQEAARHPFRRSLPSQVFRLEEQAPACSAWRLGRKDIRDFLTTYSAGCLAAALFFF